MINSSIKTIRNRVAEYAELEKRLAVSGGLEADRIITKQGHIEERYYADVSDLLDEIDRLNAAASAYGTILMLKDRAEQADRLQAELKAKNAVLAYVMEQCEEHTSQYALNVYRAAEAVLSQYRRKEDTNA